MGCCAGVRALTTGSAQMQQASMYVCAGRWDDECIPAAFTSGRQYSAIAYSVISVEGLLDSSTEGWKHMGILLCRFPGVLRYVPIGRAFYQRGALLHLPGCWLCVLARC